MVEAYCFQSNFYSKYDLNRPRDDRSYERLGAIGARTTRTARDTCIKIIAYNKDFELFNTTLDSFLTKSDGVKLQLISKLGEIAAELDEVPGIGFSKATKILHTRFPKIIPIIDNPLQKKYKALCQRAGLEWKLGKWDVLFKDYYDNLQVKETYENLREIKRRLSFLRLSKIRIFDILWWSFLKSEKLRKEEKITWRTVKPIKMIL